MKQPETMFQPRLPPTTTIKASPRSVSSRRLSTNGGIPTTGPLEPIHVKVQPSPKLDPMSSESIKTNNRSQQTTDGSQATEHEHEHHVESASESVSISASESGHGSKERDDSSSTAASTGPSLERTLWRLLTRITLSHRIHGGLDSDENQGRTSARATADMDGDVNETFVFESSLTLLIYMIVGIFLVRGAVMAAYSGVLAQILAFGLTLLHVIVFALYWQTGDFDIFRNLALASLFVVALLDHVWAGGWRASAMVMLWAFVAMLLAILYNRHSAYMVWFILYTLMLIAMALRETIGVRNVHLPSSAQTLAYFLNVYGATICIFFIVCYYKSTVVRQRRELMRAKRAAEQLLANMLPQRIVSQIKSGHDLVIDEFQSATVFFLDICQFTVLSSKVRPEQMFQFINELWLMVDDVAESYGIYKVETIGDAYMAVAGCPEKLEDHVGNMARFALKVMENSKMITCPDGSPLRFRVGFHTGPIVAGVVGYKMPHYSLFGDTVTLASRMESHGIEGEIQISPATAALLRDRFYVEQREEIIVKGFGEMQPFLLKSRREAPLPTIIGPIIEVSMDLIQGTSMLDLAKDVEDISLPLRDAQSESVTSSRERIYMEEIVSNQV